MLAHQAPDLLVVHDEALLTQRSADAAITVELELVVTANIASTIAVSSAAFAERS